VEGERGDNVVDFGLVMNLMAEVPNGLDFGEANAAKSDALMFQEGNVESP